MIINKEKYTWDDYQSWEEGARYELIDGGLYTMVPAPTVIHQWMLGRLFVKFSIYLANRTEEVFLAPFDVKLSDNTVFQPDLCILCDLSKISNGKYCDGMPEMVIEILSPSSVKMDRKLKLEKYREYGIKEYWIVYPKEQFIEVFIFDGVNEEYMTYTSEDSIKVSIFEDCVIDLKEIFI